MIPPRVREVYVIAKPEIAAKEEAARPVQRRGKAVDEAIMSATLAAVADLGAAFTVEDVAALAGVNKTTVYRRWATRDELLRASLISYAELSIPLPDTGTLDGDLFALCVAVRTAISSPIVRALISTARSFSDIEEVRRAFWTERIAGAVVLLDRGVERGEMTALPPEEAAVQIELLTAPIYFRLIELSQPASDDFLRMLVDRLVKG